MGAPPGGLTEADPLREAGGGGRLAGAEHTPVSQRERSLCGAPGCRWPVGGGLAQTVLQTRRVFPTDTQIFPRRQGALSAPSPSQIPHRPFHSFWTLGGDAMYRRGYSLNGISLGCIWLC